MLKRTGVFLGSALLLLFSLGWMIEWVMMGVWLLPVLLFVAYFFKFDPKWTRLRFNSTFGLAAASTGPWALFVTHVIGPAAPPLVQRLLHSPVRGQAEDIGSDGMVFPEFIGFVSAVGIVFLVVAIAISLTARSSDDAGRRALYLGSLSSAMVAGIVVGLWHLGLTGTAILCAMGGGMFALSGFLQDPKYLMYESTGDREQQA